MAVPTKAKDAAPTITNFNIESPAATNDKSRTNLTLLRAQQTDSRASNNVIFFDECCGNGTRVLHEKLSYFGICFIVRHPQPSRLHLRLMVLSHALCRAGASLPPIEFPTCLLLAVNLRTANSCG